MGRCRQKPFSRSILGRFSCRGQGGNHEGFNRDSRPARSNERCGTTEHPRWHASAPPRDPRRRRNVDCKATTLPSRQRGESWPERRLGKPYCTQPCREYVRARLKAHACKTRPCKPVRVRAWTCQVCCGKRTPPHPFAFDGPPGAETALACRADGEGDGTEEEDDDEENRRGGSPRTEKRTR